MASTAAVCDIFKEAILGNQSINLSSDTIKCALYNSSATLSATTTGYSSSNEITGTGYTAGGVTLSGLTVSLSSNTAYVTWTSPVWTGSTLSGVVACLIYDSTQSVAIAVLTFASASSTDSTFTVSFGTGTASPISLT